MKLIVNPHKIEIEKEPVNEKEIDITKCEFEFADEITDEFVKDVYFTLKGETYQIANIQNNECDIPYEVLKEKGDVEVGVVAYKVENGNEIKRYNPSPAYFNTWVGSLKDDYDNYEEITPSDKEQIEQMLSNISLSITKEGKIATITFTNKDGTTQTETIEDGKSIEYNWQGTSLGIRQEGDTEYEYVNLKGDKGEPGAIKMVIVNQLPETGEDDTIYLLPYTIITVEELPQTGLPHTIYIVNNKRYVYESNQWIEISNDNMYVEYICVNNKWEELGGIGVNVDLSDYYTKEETDALIPDLTDYVKNTDYATRQVGGVIKYGNFLSLSNGTTFAETITYPQYQSAGNGTFISKGTLENVIAGKNLETANNKVTSISASSTDAQYPTAKCMYDLIGNVETLLEILDIGTGAQGGFN